MRSKHYKWDAPAPVIAETKSIVFQKKQTTNDFWNLQVMCLVAELISCVKVCDFNIQIIPAYILLKLYVAYNK